MGVSPSTPTGGIGVATELYAVESYGNTSIPASFQSRYV